MKQLTDREYAKFFGQKFIEEMLELMPDLQEMAPPSLAGDPPEGKEQHIINTGVGRFLMHVSSPMVHPEHMPGHTGKLYEAAPAPAKKAPVKKKTAPTAPVKKNTVLPKKTNSAEKSAKTPAEKPVDPMKLKGTTVGGKYTANPAKVAAQQAHLDEIRKNARDRMNARVEQGKQLQAQGKHYEAHGLMNPFEHMRRGFHAAFGIDPKTGQKAVHEDDATRLKKYKASKKLFSEFAMKHGKLAPATAKNYSLFGENHKTQTSQGVGFKTIGLSLTPGTHSGYEFKGHDYDMCPNASQECRENCLGLKGRT